MDLSKSNYSCDGQMSFDDFFKELENEKWDTGQYMNLPESDSKFDITKYIPAGFEHAISREKLCEITGLKDRVIRGLIEESRRFTIIISNNDGSGYWIYPDNPTDKEKELLNKYVKQQEHRAKSIFYALYPARHALKEGAENGR